MPVQATAGDVEPASHAPARPREPAGKVKHPIVRPVELDFEKMKNAFGKPGDVTDGLLKQGFPGIELAVTQETSQARSEPGRFVGLPGNVIVVKRSLDHS